jgi:hypothetical protein
MPSESDRPIEKLMRDYAADRKSAAKPDEFEIHPITRNALKVEVVKVYGRHLPGENRPAVRTPFWPKLAWAGGGIFALALLILLVLPTEPAGDTDELAFVKRDQVEMASSVEKSAELKTELSNEDVLADSRHASEPGGSAGVYQFYAVKPSAAIPAFLGKRM